MPENTVLGGLRRFYHRSRSRSPDRGSQRGFGSSLGRLPTETSPIDDAAQTPKLFNTLILCLRPHLTVDGLFRQCAPNRTVQLLKAKAENGRLDEASDAEAHALAVLLKTWLRELPQGLIPAPFQERLLSSTCESEVLNALESLPSLNRSTLCLLFNFLSSVAQTAENRMSASALAVCIGPSLFRVQINPEGLETQNRANEIAHKFIKNYSTFFKFSGSNLHGMSAKSPKINSPTEKRPKIQRIEMSPVPTGSHNSDRTNGKDSASPINQLTPPTTPPRTPSPKEASPSITRAVENTINQFFDDDDPGDVKSDVLDETPVRDVDENSNHSRLKLPARSAPLRGVRKKPSRFHRHAMSTSQESVSKDSNHSQEIANAGENGVFERLKDGESLEGWRNSTTNSSSPGRCSKHSNDATFNSNTVQSSSTDIHIPKLDLSAVTQHKSPTPPALSPALRATPVQAPITFSDQEQTTAPSTVCNTPGTSPEPDVAKKVNSPTEQPSKPEKPSLITAQTIQGLQTGIEQIAIKKGRTSSGTRNKLSKMLTPDAQCHAVTPIDPQKERGRPRRVKPKKSQTPSKVVSPQSGDELTDHVSRLIVAVSDLESRMTEKRQISNRVDDVGQMSELQLREEKSELQRELLVLESQFGRPQAGPERQAVRMIYHRYRELKKKLSDLDNRSAIDHESALREVEIELSRIERERRELGRKIKNWEARYRAEHSRNPSNEEKINHLDYIRYRHLKNRRNFLQDLQQQKAPESFTV